ncbi:hypothetical protein Tco_1136347 [Tanacetum coccineum]
MNINISTHSMAHVFLLRDTFSAQTKMPLRSHYLKVPLQQQQLLYNGKEMRSNETLGGLKGDEDLKCECQSNPELAQAILGNDLNNLQTLLKARYNQRSELRRQEEEKMVMLYVDMEVTVLTLTAVQPSSSRTWHARIQAEDAKESRFEAMKAAEVDVIVGSVATA